MGISRSVMAYRTHQTTNEDELIGQRLRILAAQHKRYGFGKMFDKLRRAGFKWNHKRVYRVYCSLKLNLKRKPKKRLPIREKMTLVQPNKINACWSLDYMSDALMNGKKFRTINVIDDYNREALGIKVGVSLTAQRVVDFLDQIAAFRGHPNRIRVDNGPENLAKVTRAWAAQHNVELQYIQPGKPAQNAYIERFNRTYREDVLDLYLFKSIEEAQMITDRWIIEYNHHRPHCSLGSLTPIEYITNNQNSILELY